MISVKVDINARPNLAHDQILATRIVELEKQDYDRPIVVGGFVGPGLVGLISASYLIEQLNLHQVAHISSQHIPPVAVFVGGKLRHPFRIYRGKNGKLVVVICEVPIDSRGLYEISSVLLSWLVEQVRMKEVIILDGIPVRDIPSHRYAYCVASQKRSEDLKACGVEKASSALIAGFGGSMLSECLSRGVEGLSIITDASITLPDPGAVLTLIETLNSAYQLNVGTEILEENVAQLNRDLNAVAEQYSKIVQDQGELAERKTMYG